MQSAELLCETVVSMETKFFLKLLVSTRQVCECQLKCSRGARSSALNRQGKWSDLIKSEYQHVLHASGKKAFEWRTQKLNADLSRLASATTARVDFRAEPFVQKDASLKERRLTKPPEEREEESFDEAALYIDVSLPRLQALSWSGETS